MVSTILPYLYFFANVVVQNLCYNPFIARLREQMRYGTWTVTEQRTLSFFEELRVEYEHMPPFSIEYKESDRPGVAVGHSHDTFELCLYLNADMTMFVKDINYSLVSGNLLLINPFDYHRVHHSGVQSPYRRYVLFFHESMVRGIFERFRQADLVERLKALEYKKAVLSLGELRELQQYCDVLLRYFKKENMSALRRRGLIECQLFLLLHMVEQLLSKQQPTEDLGKKELLVRELIRYIDSHEQITLDLLAEKFHLSKYYLSRTFHEVAGISLWDYIQYSRVSRAQYLLRNTSDSIDSILFRCGFNNIQHFYKCFKKITGMTPGEFRKG